MKLNKMIWAALLAAFQRVLASLAMDASERAQVVGLLDKAQAEIDADGDGVPDTIEARFEALEYRVSVLEGRNPSHAGDVYSDLKLAVEAEIELPYIDVTPPRGGVVEPNA